jgi:hypothetical protein
VKIMTVKRSDVSYVVVEVAGVATPVPVVGHVETAQRVDLSAAGDVDLVNDNVVVWNPDVPRDPEMFAAYLENVNRCNNPDLFRFKLTDVGAQDARVD